MDTDKKVLVVRSDREISRDRIEDWRVEGFNGEYLPMRTSQHLYKETMKY